MWCLKYTPAPSNSRFQRAWEEMDSSVIDSLLVSPPLTEKLLSKDWVTCQRSPNITADRGSPFLIIEMEHHPLVN